MASATATALNEENPIETPDQHQQKQQSDPATTNAAPSDDVNSSPKDESKSVGDSPAVGSEAVKNEDGDAPVTDIQKKIRRAERFGTSVQLSEEEKRNSRAERYNRFRTFHYYRVRVLFLFLFQLTRLGLGFMIFCYISRFSLFLRASPIF